MKMDKKSKYLIYGLTIIFALSALRGYQVFFIERDFVVESTTESNPQIESCFMFCEAGECEEDYYKKIIKRAHNIPTCNEVLEECEPLACEPGETGCETISCSNEFVEEGERCTNPLDFFMSKAGNIESTGTEMVL